MRIGIDARFYGSLGKGLGRYASELIAQLERLDDGNEYLIFLRKGNWDEYEPKDPRFRKVLAEFQWYGWREQLHFVKLLREHRLDLMHFLHFNVPLLYRRPFVVTIHDLILLSHPTTRATTLGPLRYRIKYALYRAVIASAIRRAKRIIAVSNYTRDEIVRRFPFAKTKSIDVTYEACATSLLPGHDGAVHDGRATHLPTPYMLYVGNAYPHKNLDRLIGAFAEFRKNAHSSHHLVLVGGSDYFYQRLKADAANNGLDENVTFFGHASDAELRALYRNAQAYVFPSLCEGFGIPPLEAMCAGVPVLAANASCLPEVLGDAALWFDPENENDIARALATMADDAELRTRLVAAGAAKAAKYDWATCGRQTLEVYRAALPH
jgi:glycosyltransferase involved in cell wall biosynthesis